eukprot:2375614-Prymnesium_polylepis.1
MCAALRGRGVLGEHVVGVAFAILGALSMISQRLAMAGSPPLKCGICHRDLGGLRRLARNETEKKKRALRNTMLTQQCPLTSSAMHTSPNFASTRPIFTH